VELTSGKFTGHGYFAKVLRLWKGDERMVTLDFSHCKTEKDVKKVFDESKEELDAIKFDRLITDLPGLIEEFSKPEYEMKNTMIEIDRKILENAKDLDFHEAVFLAFPNAKREEKFGVTACGEKLLVRRFKKNDSRIS
jgi:spore coat polysaccharide biosynthesis predicted glycosyltransferase SpsG